MWQACLFAVCLGPALPLPATRQDSQAVEFTVPAADYTIAVGGSVDADNTRTRTHTSIEVAFQPNVALTIENLGETDLVNPRLGINGRGNWSNLEQLLAELTRGAGNTQEQVYLVWQRMRENLYHAMPLFANSEPHDPVKLLNCYGLALCDDAGNAGASVFVNLGLEGSINRSLNGHVQCEAMVDGRLQFMDIDQDCFYLDRENERPVSGDELARDHDLVRREFNYGPTAGRWKDSDSVASLFGPDDGKHAVNHRGHAMDLVLRPRERVEFRWDNLGKVPAESEQWLYQPPQYGNSKLVYEPAAPPTEPIPVASPYPICGGTVRFEWRGGRPTVELSLDGQTWQGVWRAEQDGGSAEVALDQALRIHRAPAKYRYQVRLTPGDATVTKLGLETDLLTWPFALPGLRRGVNEVRYQDDSPGARRVRVTHAWQEAEADVPPSPALEHPADGATVTDSVVAFGWPAVEGADRYHLQVSRRPDFLYPYRPSFDIIIPTTTWAVPYTGIFSPDETYYQRVRSRLPNGVWSDWSEPTTFRWQGPRVPLNVTATPADGGFVLSWEPNPRGEQPVRYEVYGSDEQGFSVQKEPYQAYTRGQVPGNFVGETTATSYRVAGPELTAANTNQVFYRVVAIDGRGTASGCSDFAELPHPFIWTAPVTEAKVGEVYRYQPQSLRSLGDVQHRGEAGTKHFDIEQLTWSITGPAWLRIDPASGQLEGTPQAGDAGVFPALVRVETQAKASAEQAFDLRIAP